MAQVDLGGKGGNELALRFKIGSLPGLVVFEGRRFYEYTANTHDAGSYLRFINGGYKDRRDDSGKVIPAGYTVASEAPPEITDIVTLQLSNFYSKTKKGAWLISLYANSLLISEHPHICSHCLRTSFKQWRPSLRILQGLEAQVAGAGTCRQGAQARFLGGDCGRHNQHGYCNAI